MLEDSLYIVGTPFSLSQFDSIWKEYEEEQFQTNQAINFNGLTITDKTTQSSLTKSTR